MRNKLLAVSLLSIVSANVMAQTNNKESGVYVEIGAIQAYYKEPLLNFNHTMGALKAGYNINKNFAVEAMYAGNLNSASFYYGSTNITAQVQSAYGIYGKGTIPLSDNVSLYAKIGATNGTVTASSAYGSAWSSGTSPAFGAGVQLNINKDIYASLDYMSYYNRDGVSITGPSVNLGYKF